MVDEQPHVGLLENRLAADQGVSGGAVQCWCWGVLVSSVPQSSQSYRSDCEGLESLGPALVVVQFYHWDLGVSASEVLVSLLLPFLCYLVWVGFWTVVCMPLSEPLTETIVVD